MPRAVTIGIVALVLASPLVARAGASRKSDAGRELIILVLVDALRADHVGAYGYPRPTTPELDKLAAEGRRYTRAYVNAPWTRPSTASFFTGLNASRHRAQSAETKLHPEVTTIAERLRGAGYKTAGFCANGNGGSLAGLDRGFDVFEDPTNTYHKSVRGKTYNGLPTGPFIVDKALAHLKQSKAKKEYVFLFLVDPHDPYGAPPELERQFLGPDFKGTIRRNALWEANNNYPEEERYSMMAIYDAGIRYADQALGTLFAGLKDLGLYDTAHIFVSADHGEGFGEHGFYLHAHHFWEEVIRVPLIARGPRFAVGVDERLTQSLDVAKTIVELAGADAQELPGSSLLSPLPAKARVISEYNEFGIHRQAIMDGRYKVVWQRPATESWYVRTAKQREFFPSVSFDREVVQVFDLSTDPQERRDLAANMPEPAAALLQELRAFVEAAPPGYRGDPQTLW